MASTQPRIIPYCQHPELSMSEYGGSFVAFQCSEDTPAITAAGRAHIFETLISFYDFSECRPKNKGRMRSAWERCHAISVSSAAMELRQRYGSRPSSAHSSNEVVPALTDVDMAEVMPDCEI